MSGVCLWLSGFLACVALGAWAEEQRIAAVLSGLGAALYLVLPWVLK